MLTVLVVRGRTVYLLRQARLEVDGDSELMSFAIGGVR